MCEEAKEASAACRGDRVDRVAGGLRLGFRSRGRALRKRVWRDEPAQAAHLDQALCIRVSVGEEFTSLRLDVIGDADHFDVAVGDQEV